MSTGKYIKVVIIITLFHCPFSISFVGNKHASHLNTAWAEDIPDQEIPPVTEQDLPPSPDTVPEQDEQPSQQEPVDEEIPPEEIGPKQEVHGPERGYVDAVQAEISQRVLGTAEWLDSFFLDIRDIREANRSYLRVRYDLFMEESTKTKVEMPSVNLQLRLPRLERLGRINLVFESAPEAEPDGVPVPASNTGARVLPAENRTSSAALHFLVQSTAKQSFIIRTGSQLSLDETSIFISPRYRALIPLDGWTFRFTQDVIYRVGAPWQPKTEWETETVFDLEKKLPYDLFFRSYLDGVWLKNTNEYFYNLGCMLQQPLDKKRAVSYRWNNSFSSNPDLLLDEITLSIQYRQRFWRKWLFFEVIPQYRFPRDRDFDATPGILLRLETYFGYVKD